MVPRQMRETCRPVCPRLRYFIDGWRFYRERRRPLTLASLINTEAPRSRRQPDMRQAPCDFFLTRRREGREEKPMSFFLWTSSAFIASSPLRGFASSRELVSDGDHQRTLRGGQGEGSVYFTMNTVGSSSVTFMLRARDRLDGSVTFEHSRMEWPKFPYAQPPDQRHRRILLRSRAQRAHGALLLLRLSRPHCQ